MHANSYCVQKQSSLMDERAQLVWQLLGDSGCSATATFSDVFSTPAIISCHIQQHCWVVAEVMVYTTHSMC